jgi:RimJ/RimL family protein N-acetyltransferase
MAKGWEGERLRLVPLDHDRHLDNAVEWFNDPEVTRWTMTGDLPLSRLKEKEFFDEIARGEGADVIFAVETFTGDHIGVTGLHNIDYRHGVATTGSVIGRKDLWGCGYGTETAAIRTTYAFDVLGLRLLMADVIEGNEASLRMLKKVGYKEVGKVPRRYWKRGKYRNLILLALEKDKL